LHSLTSRKPMPRAPICCQCRKMSEDIRRALIGLEITELYGDRGPIGQLKKVRFPQRVPAPDSLVRYLGMFQDIAVASAGLYISVRL
jgi:hypothetical protein